MLGIGRCIQCIPRRQQCLFRALQPWRHFHGSRSLAVVKPFILADIGEGKDFSALEVALKLSAESSSGIKEVQIIQWFVQPGARVEQFNRLCEVQSDKAATEVHSSKELKIGSAC